MTTERGEFRYRFDRQNEILITKWQDNNIVSVAQTTA